MTDDLPQLVVELRSIASQNVCDLPNMGDEAHEPPEITWGELDAIGRTADSAATALDTLTCALTERDTQITAMTAALAECYRLSGADPDGNEDWRLAPRAVAEVRRLRDEADAQIATFTANLAEQQSKLARWEGDGGLLEAVRELRGFGPEWPDHGNAPLAIAASYALLVQARDTITAAVREARAETWMEAANFAREKTVVRHLSDTPLRMAESIAWQCEKWSYLARSEAAPAPSPHLTGGGILTNDEAIDTGAKRG